MDHFGDFYAFKQVKGLHSPPQFSASHRLIKSSPNALDKTSCFISSMLLFTGPQIPLRIRRALLVLAGNLEGLHIYTILNLMSFKRLILVLEK